jgi:hypothetical protein
MPRSARVLVAVLLVLALPGWAAAVNYDFRARTGGQPVANGTFMLQGGGEEKTAKTDSQGRATLDLQPGTQYHVHSPGSFLNSQGNLQGLYPAYATVTTPSAGSPPGSGPLLDFDLKPMGPSHLWTPPPGVFSVSTAFQSIFVNDMTVKKDVRTDDVVNFNLRFQDRADAAQLHQFNNDKQNSFSANLAGVYVAAGLPTGPLGTVGNFNVMHAVGIGGGWGGVNLDVTSRSDQRAFATELSGGGGYFNADYSLTVMGRPGDHWYNNLGGRAVFSYFTGGASVDRHPKGSDGLSSLNGRRTSEPSGDLNWSSWSVGLDLTYRFLPTLSGFVGVKYREVNVAVNTKDPSFVPGPGEVNRAIDQRYGSNTWMARAGAEAVVPELLPCHLPLFVRGELETSGRDWGMMLKIGTAFDLFAARPSGP